jgi:hypothetical protein
VLLADLRISRFVRPIHLRHLKKKSLEVEITRRGKPMNVTIKIVD